MKFFPLFFSATFTLMFIYCSVFAMDSEDGLFGQMQIGGTLYENPSASSFMSDLNGRISGGDYTIVKDKKSPSTMFSAAYALRYMQDSFGIGFSTGIMGNTGNGKISYYQTSNPPTGLTSQASYTHYSFIFPEAVLLFYSKQIAHDSSITAAIGPEACLFFNLRSFTVKEKSKADTFRIPGKKTKLEIGSGGFGFVQYSQAFAPAITFDAGAAIHIIMFNSKVELIPLLFVSVTERTSFF